MPNPYAPPPEDGRSTPRATPPRPAAHPQHPQHLQGPQGPQGPQGTQAPRAPRRPPEVDPAAARAASRRVLHFGLLLLAGMVTSTLPLPLQVAAIGFMVAAVVVGVVALVAVWRSGLRGTLPIVLGVGIGVAGLMAASLTALLALWPAQMARQDCLRDALTISAREACEREFQESVDEVVERFSTPRGR